MLCDSQSKVVKGLFWTSYTLLVAGGLNWFLKENYDLDLVAKVTGGAGSIGNKVVKTLVGAAAVTSVVLLVPNVWKKVEKTGSAVVNAPTS